MLLREADLTILVLHLQQNAAHLLLLHIRRRGRNFPAGLAALDEFYRVFTEGLGFAHHQY